MSTASAVPEIKVSAHGERCECTRCERNLRADQTMVAEAAQSFRALTSSQQRCIHVAPVDEFPPREVGRHPRGESKFCVSHHTRRATCVKVNRWGRILNIASAHGLVASPFKSAYVAAKHGLVGLTKAVSLETAGKGVTCALLP